MVRKSIPPAKASPDDPALAPGAPQPSVSPAAQPSPSGQSPPTAPPAQPPATQQPATDPPPAQPQPAEQPDPPPRTTSRFTAKRLVPADNAGGVVFGVITVGALMAAESGRHESYVDMVASAVIAMLLYWLAHSYAELLGHRLVTGEPLTAKSLGAALAHDWAIVRGAAITLLAVLIAWVLGASREAGVTAGLRTAVVTVVVFEMLAGVRAKSAPGELLLRASVGVTMGVAILALKGVLR